MSRFASVVFPAHCAPPSQIIPLRMRTSDAGTIPMPCSFESASTTYRDRVAALCGAAGGMPPGPRTSCKEVADVPPLPGFPDHAGGAEDDGTRGPVELARLTEEEERPASVGTVSGGIGEDRAADVEDDRRAGVGVAGPHGEVTGCDGDA